VDHARATWQVSIRRACRALPVARLLAARKADRQRVHRIIQRQVPSRVSQRALVHEPRRCAPKMRGLARNTAVIGPEIQIAGHELRALIHSYSFRISELMTNPFEHLDNIDTAEGEPGLDRRREPREGVDDCKNAQLPSRCQLVMDKVHRPGLVRLRSGLAILAKLCLDSSLGHFVAQLQAHLAIQPVDPLRVHMPTFTTRAMGESW
jgi:hypothetical protein